MGKQIVTQIKKDDSGIYFIKNYNNKKLYIGQSKTLGSRANAHISQLEAGTHKNKQLQEDYNNGDRFRIGIVRKVDKKYLDGLEIYYILKWNTHITGYNDKIGITDNFDLAISKMITAEEIDLIEKQKQEKEESIAVSDAYKNSALATINFLLKKNDWTIDDVFIFFKNHADDYWLNVKNIL